MYRVSEGSSGTCWRVVEKELGRATRWLAGRAGGHFSAQRSLCVCVAVCGTNLMRTTAIALSLFLHIMDKVFDIPQESCKSDTLLEMSEDVRDEGTLISFFPRRFLY